MVAECATANCRRAPAGWRVCRPLRRRHGHSVRARWPDPGDRELRVSAPTVGHPAAPYVGLDHRRNDGGGTWDVRLRDVATSSADSEKRRHLIPARSSAAFTFARVTLARVPTAVP